MYLIFGIADLVILVMEVLEPYNSKNGERLTKASKVQHCMSKFCLKGKQHRDPIPKRSTWRASQRLELIHAYICGPITPISNSHKRYLICFIDDFSRKAWVNFLVEKSSAFDSFKYFKKCVEKETGLEIKCLRTDRGVGSLLHVNSMNIVRIMG